MSGRWLVTDDHHHVIATAATEAEALAIAAEVDAEGFDDPTIVWPPARSEAHAFEPSEEPARRGERRACAVCGNTEGATIHPRQ